MAISYQTEQGGCGCTTMCMECALLEVFDFQSMLLLVSTLKHLLGPVGTAGVFAFIDSGAECGTQVRTQNVLL